MPVINVLVTGAAGYVGSYVASTLLACPNFKVHGLDRVAPSLSMFGSDQFFCTDLCTNTDLGKILWGTDVVVHAAARVHVANEEATNPLHEFRRVNTKATLSFAAAAAAAGVRRFVFLSTIGVSGGGAGNERIDENAIFAPQTPYACSKAEAEAGLFEISARTGMEVVVVRPPMVYGPNCPGNMRRLIKLIHSSPVLPFGALTAARSMIYVENLVSAILTVIDHPRAANQVFVVADDGEICVAQLVRLLSQNLGGRLLLIPVPVWLMKIAGAVFGKTKEIESLTEPLRVSSRKIRTLLGWCPACSAIEGLQETADSFK